MGKEGMERNRTERKEERTGKEGMKERNGTDKNRRNGEKE